MLNKKQSVARAITQFDRAHIVHLFKVSKRSYKARGIEVRCAPKTSAHGKILIVTPRACGSSVQRNLIKRRIKSIYYQEKFFERPVDCIVFIYAQAQKLTFKELQDILNAAVVCS